ncbi:creatininase family protein [Prauserella cavernicola]|uniref:Creatininase family protein n=1 Tax=Prauserella cavernicola TaxID=2800127 RepID=A0A934V553_9PSEU|nr:creatininase family protein [Prauserella cavernicola]MBK1786102.1 creatininase family protein [Prauserella cavernicola]
MLSSLSAVYFAELSSPQVKAVRDGTRSPVLLLPVGAVEPHGSHSPVCTDRLIATGMCERAAARLAGDEHVRALVLPALSYGVARPGPVPSGAVPISPETLQGLVVDVCTALAGQGLPRIVVVNSHHEQAHLAALDRAADVVQRRCGQRLVRVDLDRPEGDARRYETSLLLAERPELVDTERIEASGTEGAALFEELTTMLVDVIRKLTCAEEDPA